MIVGLVCPAPAAGQVSMTGLVSGPRTLTYTEKDEYSPLQRPEPVNATQL